MLILDRGRDRPQRACPGVRANRADPTEQPVAQIPLLPAGQGRDSGGVIGPPLDQGQCLQDGVQLVGQLGTFLRAHPSDPLGLQQPPRPQPPRAGDEREHRERRPGRRDGRRRHGESGSCG